MSAVFGRHRSTEAPMTGIEFTNRTNTIPAWRVDTQSQGQGSSSAMKRSHSTAIPSPAPFDPKKTFDASARPVFGENVRYLFKPPTLTQQQAASSFSAPVPMQELQDVDMRDAELSPQRPQAPQHQQSASAPSRGRSDKEKERAKERGWDKENEGFGENESPERRRVSNAAVRRIARRMQDTRSRSRRYRRGQNRDADEFGDSEDEESDEFDEDGTPKKKKGKDRALTRTTSNHYTLNMPGPAPEKTDLPYVLLGYLQFMFNLSLILLFLYLLVQFIFTVQRDVEERIGEYSMDIMQEKQQCAHLYKTNLCDTTPIPAMMQQCATWETCMTRDPSVVGRAKVGAQMLGEVMDSFVESISWKTWLFTITSLAFVTAFVNGFVNLYRSRLASSSSSHNPSAPAHQQALPPPMPVPGFPPLHTAYGYLPMGQHFSNQYMGQNQAQHGRLAWNPEDDGEAVPRQRRRLENGAAGVKGT